MLKNLIVRKTFDKFTYLLHMEAIAHIAHRQMHSRQKVLLMRIIRYCQTGYLLHLMFVSSCYLVYFFGREFLIGLKSGDSILNIIVDGCATGYFFTLIFFSQLDARSRYQNYKMIKDRFFKYGFDERLLKPFMYSRCQRDAIRIAAREMDFGKEWKGIINKLGFRWYHLLPTFVVRNPLILFTRAYWSKTIFVKTYHSKYFLW